MKLKIPFLVAAIALSCYATASHATVVLWDDQDASGGNMSLTQVDEQTELGIDTGRGNIAAYDASTGGQWQNYNSGVQDWSAYAGKDWTFSVDIYVPAASHSVIDDNIYWTVKHTPATIPDQAGGFQDVTAAAAADTWTTWTRTGTFDATPANLTAANFLFLNNDKATTSTGTDFYLDNFLLTTVPEPATLGLFSLGMIGLIARRRRE